MYSWIGGVDVHFLKTMCLNGSFEWDPLEESVKIIDRSNFTVGWQQSENGVNDFARIVNKLLLTFISDKIRCVRVGQ